MIDLDPQAADMLSRHFTATCFILAALCAIRVRRWVLAAIMIFGAVESYALWRFAIHNGVEGVMEGLFPGRTHYTMQTWLIIAGIVPGLILLALYARRMRKTGGPQRVIATGGVALLAMFAVELVSRDDIVRYVYLMIGPFMIFTWWIALSALTIAAGCLMEASSRKPDRTRA